MTEIRLIVSGNAEQAMDLAKLLGLDRHCFVSDEFILMGLDRGTTVFLCGDYRYRKDWKAIRRILLSRGFRTYRMNRVRKI